jgi:hypothetical protein
MPRWIALVLALGAVSCGSGDRHAAPDASSTAITRSTQPPPVPSPSASTATRPPALLVREGSVIARALEDDALFIADEDRGVVTTLALPADLRSKHVDLPMPGRPAQVLVTRDRVFVSVRQVDKGDGAVVALRRTAGLELEEVGRVTVPADAWGLALTPDERTLLVTSAWPHALTAIDVAKLQVRWTKDLAAEPRAVVALAGDRAYVSHLVGSTITRVDGIGGSEPAVKRVELPASPMRTPVGGKLDASLGYAAIASPSGDRVYFARHALGSLGPSSWAGEGTVDALRTADDTLAAPFRVAPRSRFVATLAARVAAKDTWSNDGALPNVEARAALYAPRAMAYRRKTNTLLVASQGGDDVAELDARAMDPTMVAVTS